MQCMASGWAIRASASGPQTGTSMTSNRNLAVQRFMVIQVFVVRTDPARREPHALMVASIPVKVADC